MIYCKKCGKECSDNDKFCPSCGTKIDKNNLINEQQLCCPKCYSTDYQIEKRGYNSDAIGWSCLAVILGFLTFGIAWVVLLFILLTGFFGANDLICICKNCGYTQNISKFKRK